MEYLPVDQHGLLLRRTAVQLGLDDNWLQRTMRSGALVRIRHGAYAARSVWEGATPSDRHQLLTRAVLQQYDDRVAASHTSAHLLRGGPSFGLDLRTVNLTNLHGRGDRVQAGVTHHHGVVRVGDVSRFERYWTTSPARTAVETAATAPFVAAVCVLDWTLHEQLTTRDELGLYAAVHLREWPGTAGLDEAVARSDGRSESVGETCSRVALQGQGLAPEPQWEVFHPSGRLAGRVDLRLRAERIMVEFDGQQKYGRLLKPGQSVTDVIRAERAREVLLEELTGYRMVRLVWSDLERPAEIGRRIRRVAEHRIAS